MRRAESPLIESRFLWANVGLFLIFGILIVRLWYLQIYRGEYYEKISEHNRIRRIEIPAPRGIIFDRNGKVLLGNRPFFDLVYVLQYAQNTEETLKAVAHLIHEPLHSLHRMLRNQRGRPKFLPITLKRNLSVHEVSLIESHKAFLPGIEIDVAPRRDYNDDVPAHLVGHMGEIDAKTLKEKNAAGPQNPYLPGDLIGKQGLELRWEKYLRGQRGSRLIQVDAHGRRRNIVEEGNWQLTEQTVIPGSDLILTIDMDLQKAVKKAFQGKFGSVVVLNPQNGEILAMLSSPDYRPSIYQDGLSYAKWQTLIQDPYKPLFDRSTGGKFPPGSTYKAAVVLAALSEGADPNKQIPCHGAFKLGRDVFHCHNRHGHGMMDLREAVVRSCDVYFYQLGMELGMDVLAKYAFDLGLGERLGLNLNMEAPGLIPTSAWKRARGQIPTVGDMPNLSIGQGENLLTPLQIASLYSVIANGGKVWRPFIVSKVVNRAGEVIVENKPRLKKESKLISQEHFKILRSYLQEVVMSPHGSGRRGRVKGVTVAGKTGTAQVVDLKKNRNKFSKVSMKWKEHALFAAISPTENAEIAIAIVSENDHEGGGGAAAAPIGQKIIQAFWKLKAEKQAKIAQVNKAE